MVEGLDWSGLELVDVPEGAPEALRGLREAGGYDYPQALDWSGLELVEPDKPAVDWDAERSWASRFNPIVRPDGTPFPTERAALDARSGLGVEDAKLFRLPDGGYQLARAPVTDEDRSRLQRLNAELDRRGEGEKDTTTFLGGVGEIPAGVAAGAVGTAGTALQGVSAAFPPARGDIPEDRKEVLRTKMREAEAALMKGDVDAYSRLTREIHAEALVPVTQRAGFQAGQRVRDWGQRTFPASEGYEDSFGRMVGEGVGSLVTGIAASAVHPGAATVLFTTLGMGESADRAAQSLAEQHGQEAVDRGEFDEQIARATLLGVGPGMTDQIPVEILLKRLPVPGARAVGQAIRSFGGERVMRAIGRIGSQAVIEAVQEGGQQALQNLIARHVHTPETRIGEGIVPSAGVGGVVGGIAGFGREAVLNLAGRRSRSARGERAKAAEEVPAPSPEDEASPLPTEAIDEGRRVVADAEGTKVANRILEGEGMPAVGTPVRVSIGRQGYEGVVTDAWGEGATAGVTVTEPDGTVIDSTLEELHALGAEIEILSDAYVEGQPEAVLPEAETAAPPAADVDTTAGTETDTGGWTPPAGMPTLSPRQAEAVTDLVRGGMDADRAVATAAAMPSGDVETTAPVETEAGAAPPGTERAEFPEGELRPPPVEPAAGEAEIAAPPPRPLPEGDVETTAPVESDLASVDMAPEQGRPEEAARPDVPIPGPGGERTTVTGRPISEYGPVRDLESETLPEGDVETTAPVESEAAPEAEPENPYATLKQYEDGIYQVWNRVPGEQHFLVRNRLNAEVANEMGVAAWNAIPPGQRPEFISRLNAKYDALDIPVGPEPTPEAMVDRTVETEAPVETPAAETAPAAQAEPGPEPAGMTAMERLAWRTTRDRVAKMQPDEAREYLDSLRQAGRDVEGIEIPSGVATEIARAEAETNTDPTDGQKEAGNYAKGRVKLRPGLEVVVENPKGSERSGTDRDGKPWSVTMPATYGYVARTEGADGDQVDVYVGPDPDSDAVFIVDQVDADSQEFDEHKVMLGYGSEEEATADYDAAFNDGRGPERRGAISPVTMEEFREWLARGDTKNPVGEIAAEEAAETEDANLILSMSGKPFKTEKTARLAADMRDMLDDFEIVPVEGGFAIRPLDDAGPPVDWAVGPDGEPLPPVHTPEEVEAFAASPPLYRAAREARAAGGEVYGSAFGKPYLKRNEAEFNARQMERPPNPLSGDFEIVPVQVSTEERENLGITNPNIRGGYVVRHWPDGKPEGVSPVAASEQTAPEPAVPAREAVGISGQPAPDLVVKNDGEPFKTAKGAELAARSKLKAGKIGPDYMVVDHAGGFAIEARPAQGEQDAAQPGPVPAGREAETPVSPDEPGRGGGLPAGETGAPAAPEALPGEAVAAGEGAGPSAAVVGAGRGVTVRRNGEPFKGPGSARAAAKAAGIEDARVVAVEGGYGYETAEVRPVRVRNDGQPFATEDAARDAAYRGEGLELDQFEVVPVEGGFGIRDRARTETPPTATPSPAPRRRARAPMDALQFIAANGGIREVEGDLRAMGADRKFIPGRGMLTRKTGKTPDQIGELLHEAGYFPGAERPTVAEVYDMIAEGMRGNRSFRLEDQRDVEAREAEQVEEAQADALDMARADIDGIAEDWSLTVPAEAREELALAVVSGQDAESVLDDFMEREALRYERDPDVEEDPDALPDAGAAGAEGVPEAGTGPGPEGIRRGPGRGAREDRPGEGQEEADLDDVPFQRTSRGLADRSGNFQPRQLSLFADGAAGAVPDGPEGQAAADRPTREFRGIAKADVLALEDVRVGLTHVRSPEDAAHVAAPFRKEPQETALGIVLAEDGRLIGVVRHTAGTQNNTPLDPAHFVGAIAQLPDAHSFYLAHQHPSGKLEQSPGDAQMNRKVADLTRATGLVYRGSVVVAPGQRGASFAAPGETQGETRVLDVRPAARNASVPVYRRRFTRIPRTGETARVNTFDGAKKAVERFLPEKTGILLADNNLNVVGAFAMDPAEMARLRGPEGAARDLMSAFAETNASRMLVAARDTSSVPAVSAENPAREAINNMRRFGRALTTDGSTRDFVSILYGPTGEVVAQVDEELDAGTFLQRQGAEPRLRAAHSLSIANLRSALERGTLLAPSVAVTPSGVPHRWAGPGTVDVVFKANAVDPKRWGITQGDAWTPTHPKIERRTKTQEARRTAERVVVRDFDNVDQALKDAMPSYARDVVEAEGVARVLFDGDGTIAEHRRGEADAILAAIHLQEEGRTAVSEDELRKVSYSSEFDSWKAAYLRDLPGVDEVIFGGFTPSGNRRYLPATPKNILKEMKREAREGADNIAFGGHGKIWARWRPQITGMRQMREAASRITRDQETYEKQKEALTNEILDIGRQIAARVGRTGTFDFDTGLNILMEAGPNEARLNRVATEYAYGGEPVELPSYLIDEIEDHFRKVSEMPLQFLEAKRIAEVPMSDVAAVVVPKAFPKSLRDGLEAQGIEVRTKTEDTSDEELAELQSAPGTLFQRSQIPSPEPRLRATHTLSVENMRAAVERGSFLAPSVAIHPAGVPHRWGSNAVDVIFRAGAIDVARDNVTVGDAGTPFHPAIFPRFTGPERQQPEIERRFREDVDAIPARYRREWPSNVRMAGGAALFNIEGAVDNLGGLPFVMESLYRQQTRNPAANINSPEGKAWMQAYLERITDGRIEDAIRDPASPEGRYLPATRENVLAAMQYAFDRDQPTAGRPRIGSLAEAREAAPRAVGTDFDRVRETPGGVPYLEAKPMRDVPLSDVAAVVVPEGFPADLRTRIEGRGIEVRTKREGITDEDLAATQSVEGALFQREAAPAPILRKDGQPFKSRGSARTAARVRGMENAEVIEIEGGYALQTAWHGSPHEFDRFSTGGVGTGEGNQSYGWGLYFAEREGVAAFYRRELAKGPPSFQALTAEQNELIGNRLRREIARDGEPRLEEIIENYRSAVATFAPKTSIALENKQRAQATLQALEELRGQTGKVSQPGALYRVDLAPKESEYLLWDRPLAAQSQEVQTALDGMGDQVFEAWRTNGAWPRTSGQSAYRHLAQARGSQRAASEALLAAGVRGVKYLDGSSRNRPFNEVRDEFLKVLPQDASVEEAAEVIGTGELSPQYDAVLQALADNDWLGFDYAAQAISAAYSKRVEDWDPSPELLAAIDESRSEGTYNYVLFDDADVTIEETLAQRRAGERPSPPAPADRVRIRPTKHFDAERLAIRAEIESLGERAFGKGFNIRLADQILTPEGDQATGAFDPAARIAYIALRDPSEMTGTLHHEGLHYLRRAGAFTKQDGSPTASWKVLEAEASRWREKYKIDERYPAGIGEDLLNEEAIAEAIDDYSKNKPEEITGKVKLAMDRILAFWKRVGNAIRGRGFQTWADVFEGVSAGEFAGPDGQADQSAMDRYLQTAWHASPHTFDRFSTGAIGTGEGAQAYGWGLYFAGKEAVASWYRQSFDRRQADRLLVKGEPVDLADEYYLNRIADRPSGESFADAKATALQVVDEDLVFFRDRWARYLNEEAFTSKPHVGVDELQRRRELVESVQEGDLTKGKTTRTYRVNLAPKEDEYLLWDAQMAAQPKAVREALKSMGRGTREYILGEEMYRSASRDLGSDRAASEAFLAAGIRGIKYLDASSRPMRGAMGRARMPLKRETYNYVIFDDSDVAIEEILLQRGTPAESEAFRRWFGDSKVVDDQGRPRAVYHGTAAPQRFSAFDPARRGTNFSDRAGYFFAVDRMDAEGFAQGGRVSRAYVRVENPLVIDATGEDPSEIWWQNRTAYAAQMEEGGHDGAIVRADVDFGSEDRPPRWTGIVVAREPDQIRSAEPDMMFQRQRLGDFNTEPGAEGVDQAIIPGAEPLTDRQIAERRMRGRMTTDREQRPMDEGLFGGAEEEQMTLFQREMAATPEFRRWFGNSKAVDDQGEPLVAYHGGRFDEQADGVPSIPHMGIFFTTSRALGESYRHFGRLTQAFLKIENPFEPTNPDHVNAPWVQEWIDFWREEDGWIDRYSGEEMSDREVKDMIADTMLASYDSTGAMPRWHDFLATVRDHHDGFIGADPTDRVEGTDPTVLVVFEPTQIKSADNTGAFDPESPDIRYQRVSAENREAFEEAASQQFGVDMTGAAASVKERKASIKKLAEDIGDQLLGPTRKGKAENIAVMDIEDPKDLNLLLRQFAPPGDGFAKKSPELHKVWRQGVKAEVDQSVYIKRLNREWDTITRPLSKPEFEQLTGLMFLGDQEARAFTAEELSDFKVPTRVEKAYHGARRFIDKLGRWTEQHERAMKIDLLRHRAVLIREAAGLRGMALGAFRELYKERAILKTAMRHGRGNPDQLAADIDDADRRVHGELLEDPHYRELAGELDSIEARIENTTVRRRSGYVPHKFFGNWQIMAERPAPDDPDQSIRGENPQGAGWEQVAGEHGFFPTRLAAIRAAREFAQENPGQKLIVQPMEFNFPDAKATVLTDQAYRTLRERVRRLMQVEGEELDAVMEGVARPRNRRRFAGFEEFREGMPGFNKNLDRVIRAHIGETVRYTTLDKLKYDAITAMEKEGLQRTRATQERPQLQKAVEAFLRDVNGQKQPVEEQVDAILNRPWANPLPIGLAAGGFVFATTSAAMSSAVAGAMAGSYVGYRVARSMARGGEFPSRAITAGMLSDMSHLKLGAFFNVSSAMVNLTQTALTTYPVLGRRDTLAGMRRLERALVSQLRGKPNSDWKQLVKHDVNPTFNFGEGTKNQFQKESKLSLLSMALFTGAESFNRSVAFLGGMSKAERQGQDFTKAVLAGRRSMHQVRKNNEAFRATMPGPAQKLGASTVERTQFHYGPANKPELLRGNFLRVPLQFKNFMAQMISFVFGLRGAEIPRFVAALGLMSGALGMVGIELWDWLLQGLTGGWSLITAIKKGALQLAANGEIEGGFGQLFARGIPGMVGVDVSSRVGLGDKFLPSELRDLYGPWYSTVKNAARHAAEGSNVIDQIRNLSPGLGNPLKVLEAVGAGGQMTSPWKRNRPEMVYTPGELALKATGLRPIRESMEQDWRDITRRKAEESRLWRRRHIDRAVRALRANDRPEFVKVMREAAEDGTPITTGALRSAMRGMMTQRAERTLRTLPRSLQPEARELRRGLDRMGAR